MIIDKFESVNVTFHSDESSFIKGYNIIEQASFQYDLELIFKNDDKFKYYSVPGNIIQKFMDAESSGEFMNEHLKGKYNATA